MGYRLNEEGWQAITPIAEKLAHVPEGESLILKDSADAIKRLRYFIYSWLYETQQKPSFRVIQRNPESLEIRKKAIVKPTLVVEDKVADFVACNLLEIEDEFEVTRRVREAVQSDKLTSDQGIRALSEWSRVQGRT